MVPRESRQLREPEFGLATVIRIRLQKQNGDKAAGGHALTKLKLP